MQLDADKLARDVDRFSFASDDGHAVSVRRCSKCKGPIHHVTIEGVGSQEVRGWGSKTSGVVSYRTPHVMYRVTLRCHGDAEVALRAQVEIDAWAAEMGRNV